MYYKDPGTTTHRKFVKLNVSSREESALAQGRYAEHHKIYFPHLQDGGDNQVYSGTYLDIDFNNTTSRVVTRWGVFQCVPWTSQTMIFLFVFEQK